MITEDFEMLKEMKSLGFTPNDTQDWRNLERHIKSNDLDSLDYKIAILNKIISLTLENLREGIKQCSLMNPKYFHVHKDDIEECYSNIDELNNLLNKFDKTCHLEYFGSPP